VPFLALARKPSLPPITRHQKIQIHPPGKKAAPGVKKKRIYDPKEGDPPPELSISINQGLMLKFVPFFWA
jgi:hypothetical protein